MSKLAENGENSDKPKKGKEPQTAKMEESKGKSSDGMNEQVLNRNNGSDTIYTYEEKDRNMNEKIVAAKTLVPQSFLPQCDRKIPYAVGLGSHVDSHKDYNPLSLPTTDIIKPPSVNSIGPMPFPCTEWGFNFNLKASQNKHSGVHTGNKPYNGGKSGAIPKNFHSASNIYNCDKCSEIFLDKPSLRTHRCKGNNDGLETFLASKGKQTNMHEQETPFSCKDCDFKCIGMEGMKIHMETHKEKTFSCKDCDFKCIGMEGMKIHMETHKDKPFKCNECEFKCQKWNDMKVHMNTHKEESNFVCDIEGCNYICGEVSTLNTHKRIHEKKFSDVAKSPPRFSQTSDTNNNTSTFRQGQKSSKDYSNHNSQRNPKKSITGSNKSSPLSVTPRLHWAYVYATGYSPRTHEEVVRRDLEANIERRIGKKACVIVEKLTSKYRPNTSYSSFRISVRISNSGILLERSLWPENITARWYQNNR